MEPGHLLRKQPWEKMDGLAMEKSANTSNMWMDAHALCTTRGGARTLQTHLFRQIAQFIVTTISILRHMFSRSKRTAVRLKPHHHSGHTNTAKQPDLQNQLCETHDQMPSSTYMWRGGIHLETNRQTRKPNATSGHNLCRRPAYPEEASCTHLKPLNLSTLVEIGRFWGFRFSKCLSARE